MDFLDCCSGSIISNWRVQEMERSKAETIDAKKLIIAILRGSYKTAMAEVSSQRITIAMEEAKLKAIKYENERDGYDGCGWGYSEEPLKHQKEWLAHLEKQADALDLALQIACDKFIEEA
jgi:hypothetical protein